jgi:type VI secretion system protein ImpM
LSDTQSSIAGWYGKTPSLGDFASRRLPQGFVAAWDAWLQHGMAASRAQLGASWLDIYLNSPIWRFTVLPGICGAQAWVGLMMPSIDKVGRHFPLTLALPIEPRSDLLADILAAQSWYAALERIALATLNIDFSVDDLERELAQHPLLLPEAQQSVDESSVQELADWWQSAADQPHMLQLSALRVLPDALTGAAQKLFANLGHGKSLWWMGMEPDGPAELCCFTGLPLDSHFSALLQGLVVLEEH